MAPQVLSLESVDGNVFAVQRWNQATWESALAAAVNTLVSGGYCVAVNHWWQWQSGKAHWPQR